MLNNPLLLRHLLISGAVIAAPGAAWWTTTQLHPSWRVDTSADRLGCALVRADAPPLADAPKRGNVTFKESKLACLSIALMAGDGPSCLVKSPSTMTLCHEQGVDLPQALLFGMPVAADAMPTPSGIGPKPAASLQWAMPMGYQIKVTPPKGCTTGELKMPDGFGVASIVPIVETAQDGSFTASCTATLIGLRALLTAAHCVVDDKTGSVKGAVARIGSVDKPVACIAHPEYLDYAKCKLNYQSNCKDLDHKEPKSLGLASDIALCYPVDTKVMFVAAETAVDVLGFAPALKASDALVIAGYGDDKINPPLCIGDQIVAVASTNAPETAASWDALVVISDYGPTTNPVLSQQGDSGGPAFDKAGLHDRKLVGVIKGHAGGQVRLIPIADDRVSRWLQEQNQTTIKNPMICGEKPFAQCARPAEIKLACVAPYC